jgi:hypothetical protein
MRMAITPSLNASSRPLLIASFPKGVIIPGRRQLAARPSPRRTDRKHARVL